MSTTRCDTCQHWLRPSQRTDYRNAVSLDFEGTGDFDSAEELRDEADRRMGACTGVPMAPTPAQLPTPAASVIDGSGYFAQLYTAADFFCALWAPTKESQ